MKCIVLFAVLLHLQLSYSSPLTYNNSLPSCKPPHEYYLRSNNSCVSFTTPKSRPFCKDVARFYHVFIGTVRLTKHTVKCVPFSAQFMRCNRWVYSKDEFYKYDNATTIYIKSQKRTYKMDEFDLYGEKAVVCASETSTQEIFSQDITIYVYSTAWIISIVSLTIAFVLCIAVPAVTTYRAMMPCYIASLLASYIILVIRGLGLAFSSPFACYAVGVALQFSFLSTFFWLNVISFDFYRKVTKPVLNPGRLRLIAYMLYAWGCPLVFVGAAVAVDKIKNSDIPAGLRPNFGSECWFHEGKSRLAFFYGPISVILLMNLIFFAFSLIAIRRTIGGRVLSILRYAFELVIIMGLFWITEVLSWAVGGDIRYWYATDIVNALQGFFTLIVIARQPKIRSWLRNKCCGCKKDVEEECAFSYVEI